MVETVRFAPVVERLEAEVPSIETAAPSSVIAPLGERLILTTEKAPFASYLKGMISSLQKYALQNF